MGNSRSINSSKNMIMGFLNKTVSMLLVFVSKTIFIKVFGVEILGINGLFTNVLQILCLADLGFATAMTYSYYKPIAENDIKKIAALNQFYKKVYIAIAVGMTVIGVALIPFLKHIINLEGEVENLYLFYILTLANTVVSYLFVYKTTVLYAHQEQYIVSKYTMLINMLFIVVQIAFMLVFKNYILYLVTTIVFTLITNGYISHVADKRYPFIKEKNPLSKDDKKDIFDNLKSVFLYKVSNVLLNSTDNIIISKMISTIAVGYYSNYWTVINMITGYVQIAFNSLTASIGNVMAKESAQKQFDVFKTVQVASSWFSIVLSSCVYVLINDFIVIWIGEEFLLDNLTVIAIGVNFFLTCALNPIWTFREAAGIYKKTKYIMVVCALTNVVLSIVMGKAIGLAGVIFASAISRLVTYVWYEPIILFKGYFKKSPLSFFASFFASAILTLATTGILVIVTNLIHLDGIIGFVVKGVVCFAIANVVFAIVFCKNKYFKDLLKRGTGIIKKITGR